MFYRFVCFVTYLYVRLRFRMRYKGLEHIPAGGGFIVCANHRSFHDPVFLCHKFKQPLRFMAKEELFRNRLFGALIRAVGAFPIARGKGDTSALDIAAEILRSGGVLMVLPEGTRSKDGKPLRAKSGVAVLAARTGADVLCVSIDYGKRLGFRTPVTLRFHPILTNESLQVSETAPASMRAAAKLVMATIVSGLSYTGEESA